MDGRDVVEGFRGGEITTDAGLLPRRTLDRKRHSTERIRRRIRDPRHPARIDPEQVSLRQRLLGILAGSEDGNDATPLRHDPIFKLLAGKKDLREARGRLEHTATTGEIQRLGKFL